MRPLAVPRNLLPIIVQVFDALEYSPSKFDLFLTPEERTMADPGQSWFSRLGPLLAGTEIIYPPRPPVRIPAKDDWEILKPVPGEEVQHLQKLRNQRSTAIAQRQKDPHKKRAYTKKSEPSNTMEREKKRKRLANSPPKIVYDLRPNTNTSDFIVWTGSNGSELRTPVPHKVDPHRRDIMKKAAQIIATLSKKGFVEGSTPDILILEGSQHTQSGIEERVRECMVQNLPVFVKGDRSKDSWKDGLNEEHLKKLDIDMGCQVETLDFYIREFEDVDSGDPVLSPEESHEDEKYEDKFFCHSEPHPDQMLSGHICAPNAAASSSETKSQAKGKAASKAQESDCEKMTMHQFVEAVNVRHEHKFVLDLPVQEWSGIPYGSLNYFNHAKRVTHTLQENITYPDASWGLAHRGQIVTWFHHDCDGKMTIVNGVTGAKVWTLFKPRNDLSAADSHGLQLWMASRKEKFPKPEFGELINILILPGDTLFMPPGMMHLVYTPVPSIFQGSSFWILEALHLTSWARLVNSKFADILTNVDHTQLFVYQSLVRMILGLAVSERQCDKLYASSIIYLYDMMINGGSYIPLVENNNQYKHHFTDKKIAEARGNVSAQITDPEERLAIEKQVCAENGHRIEEEALIEGSKYHKLAVSILERILRSIGLRIPSNLDKKKERSRTWVEQELGRKDWWHGREVISVDRQSLLKLFPSSYVK
ncbi:hypothetical protein PM082_016389 [Marasmius tenuissimus]|nr:hypothetical protein PM082_016389 [Marasmius tenuissimus]